MIVGAGWEEQYVQELGNPYISAARANMTRKALDAKADVIVYLDYDLSWKPKDLLTLLETPGDVVAGTYRFKQDKEEYMGTVEVNEASEPQGRSDGCISAINCPAGFLKVTRGAINKFMNEYPELIFGEQCNPSIDLFNHGAFGRVWFGEDYAFARRWREIDRLWLVPDLDINHHQGDKVYEGNFHKYLNRTAKTKLRAA